MPIKTLVAQQKTILLSVLQSRDEIQTAAKHLLSSHACTLYFYHFIQVYDIEIRFFWYPAKIHPVHISNLLCENQ